LFDIYLGEEVVILRKNEAISLASVCSDRFIATTEAEFFHVPDLFDIVTEFPYVVDRRPLDVFVSEDAIPH
jgi:hypothetical protein